MSRRTIPTGNNAAYQFGDIATLAAANITTAESLSATPSAMLRSQRVECFLAEHINAAVIGPPP